ncbi:MAG: DinB family protein [Chloroflexota bacterium]
MTDRKIPKPASGEFPPYASMYIDLLPDDGHVLQHLEQNVDRVQQHIETLPAEKLVTPHAPNEWTVKEILVHIIDDERIYAYRALRFAREDKRYCQALSKIPTFDHQKPTNVTCKISFRNIVRCA